MKEFVQNMAVLESPDGMKQIITEVDNLRLFYLEEKKTKFELRVRAQRRKNEHLMIIKEGQEVAFEGETYTVF